MKELVEYAEGLVPVTLGAVASDAVYSPLRDVYANNIGLDTLTSNILTSVTLIGTGIGLSLLTKFVPDEYDKYLNMLGVGFGAYGVFTLIKNLL